MSAEGVKDLKHFLNTLYNKITLGKLYPKERAPGVDSGILPSSLAPLLTGRLPLNESFSLSGFLLPFFTDGSRWT